MNITTNKKPFVDISGAQFHVGLSPPSRIKKRRLLERCDYHRIQQEAFCRHIWSSLPCWIISPIDDRKKEGFLKDVSIMTSNKKPFVDISGAQFHVGLSPPSKIKKNEGFLKDVIITTSNKKPFVDISGAKFHVGLSPPSKIKKRGLLERCDHHHIQQEAFCRYIWGSVPYWIISPIEGKKTKASCMIRSTSNHSRSYMFSKHYKKYQIFKI